MSSSLVRFGFLSSAILGSLLIPHSGAAQVVPDATLGSLVDVADCIPACTITGGITQSTNLFHSFEEFSVPVGGAAIFNEDPLILNIFGRVTGSNISSIGGTLATNDASLFLLNSNGFIFDDNAALNVNGSFLATTADSADFGTDGQFGASPLQVPSILTVTAPIGLNFGSNPGDIINRSRSIANSPVFGPIRAGLNVPGGQTIALVGGNVSLEGGLLTAQDGRIEIGSVGADDFVSLSPLAQGFELGYEDVQRFQDINIANRALVNATGLRGGDIQIQSDQVILTGDSRVFAFSAGQQPAGKLTVRASESLELNGNSTSITTQLIRGPISLGNNAAGDISIETRRLTIQDGAEVASFASAIDGRAAGNISVIATESIQLVGQAPSPSSIASLANFGDGGTIIIETGQLITQDIGLISTTTRGQGNGGNLLITVADKAELRGTRNLNGLGPSGIFSQVVTGATGNGGELTLNTRDLIVLDGAQISAAGRSGGRGGDAIITVTDSILLSGTSPEATPLSGSSGIFTSAEPGSTEAGGDLTINTSQLTIENGAKVSADTLGEGPAGTATLNVDRLIIRDGGLLRSGSIQADGSPPPSGDGNTLTVNATESIEISGTGTIGTDFPVDSEIVAAAEGTGNAGQLNLSAPLLLIRDGGNIRTNSIQTSGGQITIQADVVQLLGDGDIITAVNQGEGTGGNILIAGDAVVATGDSDILAFANEGTGGNITLPAFFGDNIQPNQEITSLEDLNALDKNDRVNVNATGQIASGTITFPDVSFIENSLTELPEAPIDTAALVASSCIAPVAQQGSGRLVVTGSDNIPQQPGSSSIATITTGTVRNFSNETAASETEDSWAIGDPISEPQAFYQLTDGRTVLSRQCS
ncbi:MAG: filamentous hemagglutinin N-terminal domain-containing protein [Cyanobacteria bacterium P01_B01_bin.77]